jgi:hypothetical protein
VMYHPVQDIRWLTSERAHNSPRSHREGLGQHQELVRNSIRCRGELGRWHDVGCLGR